MGSHSVTCHPAEVTFPPSPLPELVLDLATRERCKAELTQATIFSWRMGVKDPEKSRWIIVGFQTERSRDQITNPAVFDHTTLGTCM